MTLSLILGNIILSILIYTIWFFKFADVNKLMYDSHK